MKSKIMLSIIVPVYNMERYLKDCLDSLYHQKTKYSFEVIFVDDGSSDNSHSIIESFIKDNGILNWKLYYKRNGGLSSARNYGLELIGGDYFSFLDSDDWLSLNYVEYICLALTKSDSSLIYFDRYFSYKEQDVLVEYPSVSCSVYEEPSILNKINLSACNKVYNRNALGHIRFIDGVLYEDFPYTIEVLLTCGRINHLKSALYHVRQDTPDSITNRLNEKELDMLENMKTVQEKLTGVSAGLLNEFFFFRDKTLLYWYIKLLRFNSFEMINEKDLVKLTVNNGFTLKERIISRLINFRCVKIVRALIFISDMVKISK